ncbi:MAG: DinB family protein [Alphaproteobacteria bacterium]|nr:DinB family protein [Alphaproteobacteria bacterium]
MPTQEYALMMARYNLWQNKNLVEVTDSLSDAERQEERGAFFGSIQKTFSHIFWADQIWLSRFIGTAGPTASISDSVNLIQNWEDFRSQRLSFDQSILNWAQNVKPSWFAGDLTWVSGVTQKQMNKPKNALVVQLFNHQTHHRGQIHAMLTAAGAKPGATDLPFMPEDFLKI